MECSFKLTRVLLADGEISVHCSSSYEKLIFEELMLGFSSEKQFCLLSPACVKFAKSNFHII